MDLVLLVGCLVPVYLGLELLNPLNLAQLLAIVLKAGFRNDLFYSLIVGAVLLFYLG